MSFGVAALLVVLAGTTGRVLAQSAEQTPEAVSPSPEATEQPASPTPLEATASPTPIEITPSPTPSSSPVSTEAAATSTTTASPTASPAPTSACLDFATQAEAQAFFEAEGGPANDPHGLDPDHDGMACQDLQALVENVPDANPDAPAEPAPSVVPDIARTPPRNTAKLVEQLECGLTLQEGAVLGMGRFPVAGVAYYFDDWLKPRYTPTFHLHKGLDIFAKRGTPIRSPIVGVVAKMSDNPSSGGTGVSLQETGGKWYYFGHLDRRADGLHVGQSVAIGTVIGFVGDTGNAKGGATHVHMEIHENGVPIPPKPIVDGWLDEIIADTPHCVTSGPNAAPQSTSVPTPAALPGPVSSLGLAQPPPTIAPSAVRASRGYGDKAIVGLLLMLASLLAGMLAGRRRRVDDYKLISW